MTTPPQDPPRHGLRRVGGWWGGLSEPRRVLAVWALVVAAAVSAGLWASWGGDVEAPEVPFRDVAVGKDHVCGLRTDGRVVCWGLNEIGQAESPEGIFRAIAASGGSSCGLRVDGSVECWTTSFPVPGGSFTAVSVGPSGSYCGLRPDGALECWGALFAREDRESEHPSGRFLDVSVGESQACGVRAGGELECWDGASDLPEGRFSGVSLGLNYSCGLRIDQTVACWGKEGRRQVLHEHGGSFSAVAAGEYHACGLRTDQTIECWDIDPMFNIYDSRFRLFGELKGLADPPGGEFIAVSVERNQSCGVRTNGAIVCWGHNSLLDDNGNPLYAQTPVNAPPGRFSAVSVGYSHACGLRADNTIACWGNNTEGQTDAPDGEYRVVAAGSGHACGLRIDNTITCWGNNSYGRADAPDGEFSAVASGSESCGLRTDGSIECWGDAVFSTLTVDRSRVKRQRADGSIEYFYENRIRGQRPDGSSEYWYDSRSWGDNELVSEDVFSAEVDAVDFSAVAVTADGGDTCGLRTDGRVICWDFRGQLERSLPTGHFRAISTGGGSCGLRTDGSIECWGGGTSSNQVTSPERAFSALSAGGFGGCGLGAGDGAIECWGPARKGSPAQGAFQAVSVGAEYACAVRADGALYCWGDKQRVDPPEGVHWQCTVKWWSRWLSPFNTCR